METHHFDYLSAGFLVTRAVERSQGVSAEILPKRIITACSCLAPFVPDSWCIEWAHDTHEQKIEHMSAFGLDSKSLKDLTAWSTSRFGKCIHWPNILTDLNAAKQLVNLFLNAEPDVRVLELGLHRSLTKEFCREAEPPPQTPGFAPVGRQGVYTMILNANPMSPGGTVLGFEPLAFKDVLGCSWLCMGLETVVSQTLGIRPNRHGLIEGFDQARKCVEFISRKDVEKEWGLWLPWLIIDHTNGIY